MAEQYAILSTHDLPRIRYNAPDDVLWRNMSWTSYWTKEVWILPIHRPSDVGHWVLCIIHLRSKELHLFDSFAERKPWKSDTKVRELPLIDFCMTKFIQDIMKLIARLLSIAQQHDRIFNVNIDIDGWLARPLVVSIVTTLMVRNTASSYML
jgi:hypothetical protein